MVMRQLDERRVAIAPFDVLGVDTIWRSGMVDMLSRNFDGAGPLRAAPPSVVLGRGAAEVTFHPRAPWRRKPELGWWSSASY
jgi:hypothetical protein